MLTVCAFIKFLIRKNEHILISSYIRYNYHSIKFQNNSVLTPILSPKDKCIGIYDNKNNNKTFLYTCIFVYIT